MMSARSRCSRRDRMLEEHRDGEYVLWFEADLYDQLQLVQILAKLHELEVPPSRITLICIGEHLGIAHFGGLGQLSSEHLGRLPAIAATTLTGANLEHAARANRRSLAVWPPPASAQRSGPSPWQSERKRSWMASPPAIHAEALASALLAYSGASTMPSSNIARTRFGNMLA